METLFFRNRRVFVLTVLMILAAGAAALLSIGRQEDPTITNLFATIVTPYPGADPARVEALVTEKIEQELREIAEIEEITSTSGIGISVVQVELSSFISQAEIDQTWAEIRDALSDAAANFPEGMPEPDFDNDRTGAFTTISAVVPRDGTQTNWAIMRRYAELLQDRLRAVDGTKLVILYGVRHEEIAVDVDPLRLASVGLTVDQVSRAIEAADAKVRAGRIDGETSDLLIEVTGEITSLARIRSIPVVTGSDGAVVRVSDIADVRRSIESPPDSLAYADGLPAIMIATRMEDDIQVDAWMERINTALQAFEAELPHGLEHRLLFDQSTYTADRFAEVLQNLMLGVALVIVVLVVTLGWRAALVVAAILPLASLLSLVALQMLGYSIHQMSVTGLIVALGLLVDAAIVMTDEIRKRLEEGMARLQAVAGSVRRLVVPLFASTLTTAFSFTPMVLLPGPAGDFVGAIATAVIVMLVSSFVLALTIAPALAGWMLRRDEPGGETRWWQNGIRSRRIAQLFSRSLDLSLSYPKLAILGALILPVIGFGAFPTLKAQFFPGVDRDQLHVQVTLPGSTSIAETERMTKQATGIMRAVEGVERVHWVIGESAPSFYYNMMMNQRSVASFAEALLTTTSPEATERIIPQLQKALNEQLPSARIVVRGLVQGPPVAAPVELRIVGPDLGVLRENGDRLRLIMAQVPDIIQVQTQLTGGAPKAVIDLDEEKVRQLGLDLSSVARQLEAMLAGATGGSLIEASEELRVRVRLGADGRDVIDVLRGFEVVPPNASQALNNGSFPAVPLSAIGTIRIQPAETPIYRRNGERINTVQAFVWRDVLPEEALKTVMQKLDQEGFELPAGYRFETGGDADARAETIRNLLSSIGLIISLTIATVVLTFNSFRLSAIAGVVAILSMGLSLLALAVFGYPFGILAVIGVIGSIGVSINAAIIIMTALQQEPAALQGDTATIRDVVVASSRHIVSTTITTFGGFLPLILAGGGFWPPFAMSIAGGVLLSTVVSFYFTPPAFLLATRPRTWRKAAEETGEEQGAVVPDLSIQARAA